MIQIFRDRNGDGVLAYFQEDIPGKPIETVMKSPNAKANIQKKEKRKLKSYKTHTNFCTDLYKRRIKTIRKNFI